MAIGLCMALFIGMPMQSFAMEAECSSISPRFTYISDYCLDFSISGGNANIYGELVGNSDVTSSSIKCNLEKLTGSTYWMQIKSFSASGGGSAILDTSYSVSSGMYRVMAVFKCNTETQTVYSPNVTY